MGGKKKNVKQVQTDSKIKPPAPGKQIDEEKKFVNLLHVYTIYKQKFRRINQQEFEKLLRHGCQGKKAAIELCKEFMKAKQIPDVVDFEKNVGFLSVPRLMPLIALLSERAGYQIKPSLVSDIDFTRTPERFKEKFVQLLVHGFWFLGRVISDSLSVKEQVNRGNMFNFVKGDMGFWWAGVKILDWNIYVHAEKHCSDCHSFVIRDSPKYRLHTNSAVFNMHQHPMYFLLELDWQNYSDTIKSVRHNRVPVIQISTITLSDDISYPTEFSESEISSIPRTDSDASINTLASRESVD